MRQLKLKTTGSIHSLQELRYEKARIKIELLYLRNELKQESESFLHGGFLEQAGFGWNLFASTGKWMLYGKIFMKVYKWIKKHLHVGEKPKTHT